MGKTFYKKFYKKITHTQRNRCLDRPKMFNGSIMQQIDYTEFVAEQLNANYAEINEIYDEISFQLDGEESTLVALQIQERLAYPFIPVVDPFPEEGFEVSYSRRKICQGVSKDTKMADPKTQKFTGRSIRRALSENSTSPRGIPRLTTEGLQSLIHGKMLLEQHMRRQAKKKQYMTHNNLRKEKYYENFGLAY